MEEAVRIESDGLKLAGVIHFPPDRPAHERRPAFLVLHGFGGNKDTAGSIWPASQLAGWGYVALRFDYRGCGDSEGERARIICMEQVADTSNVLTYLANRPEVDPDRIALVGSSFGAAVAVYTGGVDKRVAGVISQGGWGDGERKFRGQRERTGQSLMVPRYDIVPIPEHLRNNLNSKSIMEFPAETAQSMFDFRADDVVAQIAPRPLMLLHSANDSVTPTEQSIEMFKRSKPPTELHLMTDVDQFMFGQENPRVIRLIKDWLDRYLPVRVGAPA
jgi:uncharacterized protein